MEVDFNTVLAMAFGLWAGVVAWIGRTLGSKLDKIVDRLETESAKLNQYIVQTESRLAVLEDRMDNHVS